MIARILACIVLVSSASAADRARDLGIPFDGTPGPLNAITDVAGVTVGLASIVEGSSVRTGVTAILPRGRDSFAKPVFAGIFSLNGNGEMTGSHWVEESGMLEGPVMITNTHSVGVVRDAVIKWRVKQAGPDTSGYWWSLPVVAETWDGYLNDVNGFHVTDSHAFAALDSALSGPVREGATGGGTGMVCYEFKCGTGTSSRRVTADGKNYTVGALVQANHGIRDTLTVAGVPVGKHLRNNMVYSGESGSIIIVIATDAPLLPHQLKRVARRAAMGLARNGSFAGNGSGDIFIAFSTANAAAAQAGPVQAVDTLPNDNLDNLFRGTVEAVEEAIINALVAGRDMTGNEGHKVSGIDIKALKALISRARHSEK